MASITNWSRLEPRVRSDRLARGLQAQVRDPLWMLTRQWQFGEYQGEDAGSLIKSQITVEHRRLTHYRDRSGRAAPLDANAPLETRVEREPVPMDVRARVQAGLHFARLLVREGAAAARATFMSDFPISAEDEFGGAILDEASQRFLAGVAGRVIDGGAILEAAANGDDLGAPFGDVNLKLAVRRAVDGLVDWFGKTYSQAASDQSGAWSPPHLEYQFAVSSGDPDGDGMLLDAPEYSGGRLDWYAFDAGGRLPAGGFERETIRVMPSPVTFRGMPGSRWWEFEEGLTDFGRIDTHTTDLGRLLLAEFGLIYGDDWFVLPYDAPVGSIVRVSSLIATDVFGLHVLVRPAGRAKDQEWQRSQVFALSPAEPGAAPEMFLFLPPALAQASEGPALEQVVFLRDEMANMAWGVERTLPNGLGEPIAGYDAVQLARRKAGEEEEEPEEVQNEDVQLVYRLASLLAENWIPFVPVRTGSSRRSIALEKAALLSQQEGEEPEPIPARGSILNPGLDPYRIHDEEIPRASRRVTRGFQRARWVNGSTYLWIGRRKRAGRGEGSSGLAFDQIAPIKG